MPSGLLLMTWDRPGSDLHTCRGGCLEHAIHSHIGQPTHRLARREGASHSGVRTCSGTPLLASVGCTSAQSGVAFILREQIHCIIVI